MLVYCFTISVLLDTKASIDEIYKEFGENIPNYIQYEGGSQITYLCCVDKNVNIIELCEKYKYECSRIDTIDIEEDTFNNSYTIYPSYAKYGPSFHLEKNPVYNSFLTAL